MDKAIFTTDSSLQTQIHKVIGISSIQKSHVPLSSFLSSILNSKTTSVPGISCVKQCCRFNAQDYENHGDACLSMLTHESLPGSLYPYLMIVDNVFARQTKLI
jgi:hypothetical protein